MTSMFYNENIFRSFSKESKETRARDTATRVAPPPRRPSPRRPAPASPRPLRLPGECACSVLVFRPSWRHPGALAAREKGWAPGHPRLRLVNHVVFPAFCCILSVLLEALAGLYLSAPMKPKPVSHKTENTYRFLTFAERLGNVNIDIIHRIDRTASYDEEVETYFFEGLLKWRELNLTEHFGKFYKEVIDKCQSFNQLVYHQNEIVQSLKTHLQIRNSFAYQPLLDLVVQLARDLQMDFYPHFQDFFLTITSILETQDTELLEWAFTSLSYLYKYLWRLMVKDMSNIYSLYSTLLAHKKLHIRNFAAESFTFLMRK
uniref:Small subunit processome component 20 homolog n=1 Tax=Castor canadensis TaxID=51338 RepID=A0A8B7UPX2_CASCN